MPKTRSLNEPQHDKTNKMSVCPAKTKISLGIRPVRSESSLSAWRNLGSLATHWAYSEDSHQTGRMPRLIWVFAGHTLIFLVLSCRGSNIKTMLQCVKIFAVAQQTHAHFQPQNVYCDQTLSHWKTAFRITKLWMKATNKVPAVLSSPDWIRWYCWIVSHGH